VLIVAGVFGLVYAALRWADRRVRGHGRFALAVFGTYALAAMFAVGLVQRLDAASGMRASVAQLRLLDTARDARRLGVRYDGAAWRFSSTADLVSLLSIASPPRLAGGRGAPPLVLPGWFPAGTYVVSATVPDGRSTPYEVRVLRAATPILRGASERFAVQRANSARRYGRAVAWFVDERAFDDPDGIWIQGGGTQVRLVLQPDSGDSLRVLVRNGPLDNEAALSTEDGDWSWSAPMTPGEERELNVPIDSARGAVSLRVVSRRGFRPAEIDPSSRDTRLLGVWLSPR
jgi:hypothetical protein